MPTTKTETNHWKLPSASLVRQCHEVKLHVSKTDEKAKIDFYLTYNFHQAIEEYERSSEPKVDQIFREAKSAIVSRFRFVFTQSQAFAFSVIAKFLATYYVAHSMIKCVVRIERSFLESVIRNHGKLRSVHV